VIAERFRFCKRDQRQGESVSQYVAVIKKLAETCNFGDFLNTALRDKFVCDLLNEPIQKRLLTEAELTFAKALNISCSMETASKDSHELAKSRMTGTSQVHKVSSKRPAKSKNEKQMKTKAQKDCFRCGMNNHVPDKCYFRERECYKCKKIGHSKSVCTAKVHQIRKQVDSDEEVTMYYISEEVENDAIFITLNVEEKNVKMELDTGASVSVIGLRDYKKFFPHKPLRSTKLRLQMYN